MSRRSLTVSWIFRGGSALLFLCFLGAFQAARAEPERLSVVYCVDCYSFEYQDENGEATGLIIDYWRLWSEKTGIALDFTAAPWDETLKMMGDGAVDAHAGLFYSEARDEFLEYGTALRKTDTHIFFHRSLPTTTDSRQLAAYRIGVLSGDLVEGYLEEQVPDGLIVGYPDYETLLTALASGELKVFAADTPTGLHHLERAGLLAEFTYVAEFPLYQSDWFTAAQEGDTATIDLINRGMALITEEEQVEIARRWIGDADETSADDGLIVAIDRKYAPFTFINAQGKPAGLFVDIWRAWAEKAGQTIRFRPSNWAETIEGLRTGEADMHSGLSYSPERAEWLGFSRQIYETSTRVFHRTGDVPPADFGDFGDRVLGAWSGSMQEAEARRLYPELRVQAYPSAPALIRALLDHEVGAVLFEERPIAPLLREMGLQNEVAARPERLFISTIHAGVPEDRRELLGQIETGLALLSGDEMAAIEARWIVDPESRFYGRRMTDAEVGLSHDERAWLNAHPMIRLGSDRAWTPYEYLDEDGVHSGLSAQFMDRIEQIIGVTFQSPPSLAWAETEARAKAGELDVLSAVAPTTERNEYLTFTEPYLVWPNVIAARIDAAPILGVDDLDGLSVGVVSGYAIEEVLSELHPEAELVPQADVATGLRALSAGQIDAFVDSRGTISYFKEQLQQSEITIVAETPYILEVAFGVRKDWPELATILDKALAQISAEERLALAQAAGLSTDETLSSLAEKPAALLSATETAILIGVVAAAIGLLVALIWVIRSRPRPFLKSLRGKSLVFIGGVFILIGGATIWALFFVGERVSDELGTVVAKRQVLWHREKVMGAIQRELALAQQMASSELLIRWSEDEADETVAAAARRELQRYHDNFSAHTYFVGLERSGHFFYADGEVDDVALDIVDTLSREDLDDVWFYATLEDQADFNLNVDHNTELGVTNLWVNYAMRGAGVTHGVVGTGIVLTQFIDDFIALSSEGISAMMIDKGGAIQAHVDPSKITQNVLGQESGEAEGIWRLVSSAEDQDRLRRHMARLQTGHSDAETLFLRLDGERRLVAMSYLEPLGWYSVAVFEPGVIVGLHELGALAVVLGIAMLITVVIFVVGQNFLIIRPIDQLTEGAYRMSGGDYDVSLNVGQQDEIGDLTRTFNEMAAIIADYTGTLEERVEARTSELQDREARLRDSEQRMRSLLEESPAAVAVSRASDGHIIFTNERAHELLLVTDEEMKAANARDFYVDAEERKKVTELLRDGTGVRDHEIRMKRSDGKPFDALTSVLPLEYKGEPAWVSWMYDITERKQAEEAVRESEQRANAILNSAFQLQGLLECDGTLIDANAAALSVIEAKREDVVGLPFWDCPWWAHDLDLQATLKESVERAAAGETAQFLATHPTPDGSLRQIDFRVTPVRDDTGNVVLLVPEGHDITELKKAEEAVRESEQRMFHILESSPIGVAIVRLEDGHYLFGNKRIAQQFGIDEAELLQTSGANSWADLEVRAALLKELKETGEVNDAEVLRKRLNGEEFWGLQSMSLIEYEGEEALLGWLYDITERKQAEEAVRESETRLLSILRQSPIGLSIVHPKDGHIVFANSRLSELFGTPEDELIGNPIAPYYVDPNDRKPIIERMGRDGFVYDVEIQMVRRDGERFWTLLSVLPIDYEGETCRLSWYYDITERKKAEEQLAQALSLIRESLDYASHIQRSLLPADGELDNCLHEHFVLWHPRDVVGGDIYWHRDSTGGDLLVVCDCTGHGIPGAFMTLIGNGALNHALVEHPDGDPAAILGSMNRYVKRVLRQDTEADGYADDGMELGICRIDRETRQMTFAGARFSLLTSRDGEFNSIKGDRSGIGYRRCEDSFKFSNTVVDVEPGTAVYLTSDGLIDQIGGRKRRSYGKKRLLRLLLAFQHLPMDEQGELIWDEFVEYQGDENRRDDVTMVGFRLSA